MWLFKNKQKTKNKHPFPIKTMSNTLKVYNISTCVCQKNVSEKRCDLWMHVYWRPKMIIIPAETPGNTPVSRLFNGEKKK